jgi:hypothetical protein
MLVAPTAPDDGSTRRVHPPVLAAVVALAVVLHDPASTLSPLFDVPAGGAFHAPAYLGRRYSYPGSVV